MKALFNNKIVIGSICFIVGLSTGLGYSLLPAHSNTHSDSSLSNSSNSDDEHDPFEALRKQMSVQMVEMDSSDIRSREDDQFYYYDITAKGIDQGKLNVRANRGQIEISGQIETKEGDAQSQHIFSSTFERSFPIPQNADAGNLKVENENGIITLKIPKIH